MRNHTLHYIDMHPVTVGGSEPPTVAIWLGAAAALAVAYVATLVLFTL